MTYSDGQNSVQRHSALLYALLILPSVTLGILAMILGGVSPAIWGQQIVAWAVLALLARALRRPACRIPPAAWTALLLIPLAATLFGESIEGARRWLDMCVFNVNAAMLVLPALLVILCRMKCPYPALLSAAVVLCVQPDMSQLTAFSIAVLPLLWNRRRKRLWTALSVLMLAILVFCCLLVPVTIQPVEYCEGILMMLGDASWMLRVTGVILLAAIPVFWGIQFFLLRQPQVLCLSVYYVVSIMFALSGEYPVPFMGFGLSPIAGYFLAYICCSAVTDDLANRNLFCCS